MARNTGRQVTTRQSGTARYRPLRGELQPANVPGHVLASQPGAAGRQMAARPRALRRAGNRAHRHRYQLRPWVALGAVGITGLAAHLVPGAAGWAWLAVVPAAEVTRRLWKRLRGWGQRVYAVACVTSGTAWVVAVTAWGPVAGPGRLALAALVVPGMFPLAWVWWQQHQTRPGHDATVDPPGPDPVIVLFADNFAAPGRPGAGLRLTGPTPLRAGRAYVVHLIPGKHTPEEVVRLLPALSSALAPAGIVRSQLVLEPMPGETVDEPGPDHLARLTVLERRKNTQQQIQEFTGSTLNPGTGLFADGPYPDGEMAMARLYKTDEHGQPMRTASGLYVGAQGSGKSRLLEHKMLEHMHSGVFLVWFIDGMGGSSMPGLLDYVDWPAIHPSEWERVLKAAARLRVYRARQQTARREGCWYATPEEPFVQIVIDEAHLVLRNPACVRLVKMLLQEAEKTGIGVDLVTHVPLLAELGDQSGASGSHVIRGLAKDGNVAVFRTGDEWTKRVTIGSWQADPLALPQRPGMHYLATSAALRQAPVRAIRAADPAAWAAAAPVLKLSAAAARACDGDTGDYYQRHDRFAAYDQDLGEAGIDMDDLNSQVDAVLGIMAPPPARPGAQPAPEGPTAMRLCLTVLERHGRIKRKALIEEIRAAGHDYSESMIAQALRGLKNTGAVTNKGGDHGEWVLCAAAQAGGPGQPPEPSDAGPLGITALRPIPHD